MGRDLSRLDRARLSYLNISVAPELRRPLCVIVCVLYTRYLTKISFTLQWTTTNPVLDSIHTWIFDFSSPHRSKHSSACISRFSPGINTTSANMIHFYVGVASNPKFSWTTVLSSTAQRDALVVFRFRSDNCWRGGRIVASEPRCQLTSCFMLMPQETFPSDDVFAFFLIASPESVGVWLPLSCDSATNRSMSALPRDPCSRKVLPHEIRTGRYGMESSASSQDVLDLVVCFHIMLLAFFAW